MENIEGLVSACVTLLLVLLQTKFESVLLESVSWLVCSITKLGEQTTSVYDSTEIWCAL